VALAVADVSDICVPFRSAGPKDSLPHLAGVFVTNPVSAIVSETGICMSRVDLFCVHYQMTTVPCMPGVNYHPLKRVASWFNEQATPLSPGVYVLGVPPVRSA
jgi:hypothetical protein